MEGRRPQREMQRGERLREIRPSASRVVSGQTDCGLAAAPGLVNVGHADNKCTELRGAQFGDSAVSHVSGLPS